ncbi:MULTISPECIES: hypothetical protein [unclassified Rhodococcus (in: high G+C Gram-positive bacteria)]|uniref:hypothetical protein n=1 Tax=unclassified Rhodococcus (in: high G+C Gram-positive bacteria) TaxID=192944 RepID=UPI00163A7791|nr:MULTISPECIES: hypothetical protein [unclassified Rhodococcus (in: high G+C Gram-positive bacteria)]MBC2640990.1 hypothetical protein [Rhodococcus sp. 3A]MBC2894265.1 hypothetical protein [Rhodococcus sp. 4CII]
MSAIVATRRRPARSREEERLANELEDSRRRIIELMAQLAETARSRDALSDHLQVLAWNARWGRAQIGFAGR